MSDDESSFLIKGTSHIIQNYFQPYSGINQQKQVELQKIIELQDQDNRNFTLGGLLSCLETIAFRISPHLKNRKYDGYNPKSVQDKKNVEQLIAQLRLQSKAFQNMYEEYMDNNDEYWFPENLTKEEIINDIKTWKRNVLPEYKIYYDNIIYLFEGKEEKIEYPKKINGRQLDKKPSCPPKTQLKLIPPNIGYINYRRKIVKDNYLKNKKFDNNLQLFKNKHCDPIFESINEKYKKVLESHGDFCDCENCKASIENFM